MICKICGNNYEGHFNSKYCSKVCKKKGRSKVNLKYNTKIKNIKQEIINNNILDGEIWKPVPIQNFENYYISNKGRVKSDIKQGGGGFLKKYLTKTGGYYSVQLRNKNLDNKTHGFFIHRLIALAFIDNPDNLPIVDHINRVRTDNRLENLRWADYKINANNKKVNGSVCIRKEKYKLKSGEIKTYNYYRVSYRHGKRKCFKNKEDAIKYLNKLREKDPIK